MMLASAGAMMTANRTGVTSGTSSSLGVRTVSVSRRWYSVGTLVTSSLTGSSGNSGLHIVSGEQRTARGRPDRRVQHAGRDREADPAHGLDAARVGLHQLSGEDRRGARRGIPVRPAG